MLLYHSFKTPIGEMTSVSSNESLYLLDFSDSTSLRKDIEELSLKMNLKIDNGLGDIASILESEMHRYFNGDLQNFSPQIYCSIEYFTRHDQAINQKRNLIYKDLISIPYGSTRSYKDIALNIGMPNHSRYVGSSMGTNKFLIILPCHRVVRSNGELGGYSAGIDRKIYLQEMEFKYRV